MIWSRGVDGAVEGGDMTVSYTLDSLTAEQELLLLDTFSLDLAWELGARMRGTAAERKAPVAIEIASAGTVVFTTLLPGATPDNIHWVRRKRAVAERFHKSSLFMRLQAEARSVDFHQRYRLPNTDYAASGGGVPLILKGGALVGSVGVSGLPDVEDHALATTTLLALLGR
jgi:uncharacterized protein (UPF0303 family)